MQNINLYIVRRTPRRGLFSRAGLLLLAAALASACIGWHLVEGRRLQSMQQELARVEADRERLQRQLAQVPSAGAAIAQRIAAESAAVQGLEAVAQRLGQGALANNHGFAAPLRTLARAHADGVWLAGLRLDNTNGMLQIEGRALDAARVPAYLAALRADPSLAGLAFAALDGRAERSERAGPAAPATLAFTLRSVPLIAVAPTAAPAAGPAAKSAADAAAAPAAALPAAAAAAGAGATR